MTELPRAWRSARLAEVCEVVSGGTPKTGVAAYWDGDIPWVTPKDLSLDKRQVLHGGARSITREGLANSSAKLFPAGSVIVSSRAPIGYVAIAGEPMSTNQGCKIAVPPSEIDSRFLYWYLLQAKHDMDARASGTTFKEISGKEFGRTLLRWPTLGEQRRIVEILEDHLSRLVATARGLALAGRRLDQMRISALMAALQAAEHPGARRQMSFGTLRFAVPDAWEASTVGAMSEVVEYGSGAKAHSESGPGRVPVLRMGNVKGGALIWDSLKYLPTGHPDVVRLRLAPGDLLFNRTNSAEHVGKSAVFHGERDATFASYLIRVRFNSAVNPIWASRVINSPLGRQFVSSVVSQQVGQANVNGSKLRAFPLPVPPRAEQDAIVSNLAELDDAAQRLKVQLEVARGKSGSLRRSLLAAAFSGRLVS